MTENQLFYGDNLDVLRGQIDDHSVDLIYLDPPFNSKVSYNILFGGNGKSQAQIHAFDDTWHWGPESERSFADVMGQGGPASNMLEALRSFLGDYDMMAYLAMMTPRLIELRRVLKKTGTLYLHCDPTASHYLKILMDAVFDARNFRNEIIWCYAGGGVPKKDFPRKHDVILRYVKGNKYTYHPVYRPYTDGTKQRGRTQVKGKYHDIGLNPKGTPTNDWWADVPKITSPTDPEKLGYPTQKSLALLERIIGASSNKDDVVLDPFCGCGTTIHAAQKLGRKWIGIDITHLAISLIEFRLCNAFGIRPKVIGAPEDLAGAHDLFRRSPFQFEAWSVTRLLGIKPNERKTGDKGVDGVGRFYLGRSSEGAERYGKILVSVKGGKQLNPSMVRDSRGAIEREGADLGVFICLHEPTRGMISEAASAGRYRELEGSDFPCIQIYTIKDHFEGKRLDLPPAIEEARRRAATEGGEQPNLI